MSDFHRVLLGLHAQARRIDRDQALLGALGVGAIAYPHQVDNVHRMVTGTACRWLLADEVGLGKTVQAIMAMRALAAQSPRKLNVALIVPEELTEQWAQELLCRGNILPISADQGESVGTNIVLCLERPSQLVRGRRLSPEKIDLLIIDEFTKLQVQVRQDLIAAAQIIPNVLALTATPALHLATTRRELMALLEPEASRTAKAADRDILEVLIEREKQAIDRYYRVLNDSNARSQVEESYGLYRRLIRTKRSDYPNSLPIRIYQPVRLAGTDGDFERARTTRDYLAAAMNSNLEIRRDTLLQVAGRSPQSLRERLSTLRQTTAALQKAWQEIDICLHQQPGDGKLDELIDHLRKLHTKSPDVRVVIVAEDNPTTDYLCDTIEKLADLKVAKKRRLVSPAEALDQQVAILKDALDDFINSEAKVLVAADAAREGHNLQFADEIIFFALPWSPPDIQQWIGRIDRLGTKHKPGNRRIAITPVVIKGSIEERILEVLEGTGVFLRSEIFDESEWERVRAAIGAAAEGRPGASWTEAAREAQMLGEAYDAWSQATSLPPSRRTAIAMQLDERFRARPYAVPMTPIGNFPWNWYFMREHGVEKMIRLAEEDYLDVRSRKMGDQRFFTMWYKSKPGPGDLMLPDVDPRSSWYRQAYISRRTAIGCPPRSNVVENDGERRQLHFFDHGCTLHDQAVTAFEEQTPSTDIHTEFVVGYQEGHPALQWAGYRLLVATAELDFKDAISFDLQAIVEPSGAEASKPERDARSAAARVALAQFQADRRWMIDLASPEMVYTVLVEADDEMVIADSAVPALLDPIHDRKCARQLSKQASRLTPDRLIVAQSLARNRLCKLAGERISDAKTAVRNHVQSRLFAAQADAENLIEAARTELVATEALDPQYEFNKAAVRGSKLALALAEATWDTRLRRLDGMEEAIGARGQLINVRLFWIVPQRA